jgi:hypothetical protein
MPILPHIFYVAFLICVILFGIACLSEFVLTFSALIRGFKNAKSVWDIFPACQTEIQSSPRLTTIGKMQVLIVISAVGSALMLMLACIPW